MWMYILAPEWKFDTGRMRKETADIFSTNITAKCWGHVSIMTFLIRNIIYGFLIIADGRVSRCVNKGSPHGHG